MGFGGFSKRAAFREPQGVMAISEISHSIPIHDHVSHFEELSYVEQRRPIEGADGDCSKRTRDLAQRQLFLPSTNVRMHIRKISSSNNMLLIPRPILYTPDP